MTPEQLLQLLKDHFADFFFEDHTGKCKSTLQALELIEDYKKQIQNETIKDCKNIYRALLPDEKTRNAACAELSRKYENPENTLVK